MILPPPPKESVLKQRYNGGNGQGLMPQPSCEPKPKMTTFSLPEDREGLASVPSNGNPTVSFGGETIMQ